MQTHRVLFRYGGYRDVFGELYDNRFVLPENISKDKVCLFPIIDLNHLERRMGAGILDWAARPQGFGVSWDENAANFLQVFSYQVASPEDMQRIFKTKENDPGGYYYLCNKSVLYSRDRKFLPKGVLEPTVEILGWGYHSSRYLPYAEAEAAAVICQIAEEFGHQLSQRVGREFEAVLPDQRDFSIREKVEEYKGKKPTLFTSEQLSQFHPKLASR